jgi:hypothetical protein
VNIVGHWPWGRWRFCGHRDAGERKLCRGYGDMGERKEEEEGDTFGFKVVSQPQKNTNEIHRVKG